MKKLTFIIISFFLTATGIIAQQNEFPKLTGPYLGQTPPKSEPVLFAPGIVSTSRNHSSVAISPDGKEIYWAVVTDVRKLWGSRMENGRWTKPEMLTFCKDDSFLYDNPFITPDGKKLFFTSFRPGVVSKEKETIWYCKRTAAGWSDPEPVSIALNETPLHWSISVSNHGTLYFQFQDMSGKGKGGTASIQNQSASARQ